MAWTTPATAVAGTLWTAANYNTYARDNRAFLFGALTWTTIATTAGWAVAGGWAVPAWRQVGTRVWVRGRIGGGSMLGPWNTTPLPVAARPINGALLPAICISTQWCIVDQSGNFTFFGGTNTDCNPVFNYDTLN